MDSKIIEYHAGGTDRLLSVKTSYIVFGREAANDDAEASGKMKLGKGANDYVVKPVQEPVLKKKIYDLFGMENPKEKLTWDNFK